MLTKLTIPARELGTARRVAGVLEEALVPAPLAVSVFESKEAGHLVEAYFEEAVDAAGVAAVIDEAGIRQAGRVEVGAVPDLDWVAISQAALPPVAAGRYVIHGSHDRGRVGGRIHAIEIEAGEAFGTAHHATTLGCLEAIDRLARCRTFRNVLDLGCGTGVLAIAAAYALPAARVVASDIDPEAVRVARSNARLNGGAGRIEAVVADGLGAPALRRRQPYDLVVANILANPLIALAPQLARAIRPGGLAVLSGLLVEHGPQVVAAYRASGFDVVSVRHIVGWTTLVLKRAPRT